MAEAGLFMTTVGPLKRGIAKDAKLAKHAKSLPGNFRVFRLFRVFRDLFL
jgi:hypothetical protein